MIFLWGALMIAAVIGLLAKPVLRPDLDSLEGTFEDEGSARPGLEGRKAELIDAIKDLDFDLQTGKLSPRDHRPLRSRLEKDVFAVYREMGEHGREASLLEEIEREVSGIREKSRLDGREQPPFCHGCGRRASAGARYCPSCGTELAETEG